MTNESTVNWCYEHFAGSMRAPRHPSNSKWRPSWTWALIRQADLQFLLPLLIPYLHAKKGEATRLLEYIDFIDSAKPLPHAPQEQRNAYNQRRAELAAAVREPAMLCI